MPKKAKELSALEIGRLKAPGLHAVGGVAGEFPAYAASIAFPGTELPSFDVIRVVACPIVKQRFFSCLIGRDILQKWLLNYDGKTGELEVRA